MDNHNFDIDQLKEVWQQQPLSKNLQDEDITAMLNKKSNNYVKYILWISSAEFLFFFILNIITIFQHKDSLHSFHALEDVFGIQVTEKKIHFFEIFKEWIKWFTFGLSLLFIYIFYNSYKKIKIETSIKNYILQVIKFRNNVRLFILLNLAILIFFSSVLLYTIYHLASENQNTVHSGIIWGILISIILTCAFTWLYYRVVYGILIKRLSKNLEQLKKIEKEY